MKFEASDKVAQSTKKPHIKKGYYHGQLTQVKPRKDKDGNWIEGKFGRQIILLFAVHQEDKTPIKNPDNESEILHLATVLNSEYKDKDGGYRTAVTLNARITKVFEAMGWKFTPEGFDTDDFIGKWVEINVDDYEVTDDDGNKYKASSIKDINKLEGENPSTPIPKQEENKSVTKKYTAAQLKKIEDLKNLVKMGMLSQKGYDNTIEQMENGS